MRMLLQRKDGDKSAPTKARPRSLAAGQPMTGALHLQRQCACGGGCARCLCDPEQLLQPKLRIGAPDDRFEREADRIADQVMRMEGARSSIACPSGEANGLCAAADRSAVPAAPADVSEVLNSAGHPLDPQTRSLMEAGLGHDLSSVRVHTDAGAAASARALNARAFTVGHHIAFAEGGYRTSTSGGRRLLAHELAHTIQQTGNEGTGMGSAAGMEAGVERGSHSVRYGQPARIAAGQANRSIQRQPARVTVRSPVFEETVTQLSDVAGRAGGRPLLDSERQLAEAVFGDSLSYDRIRLVAVNALQFRTIGNNIYIPNDFSIADAYYAQTLIHELVHVWQYQRGGTSYISHSLVAQIGGALRGSRNLAYDYVPVVGASFFDYNPEQQALVVENYYSMKRDQQEIAAGATTKQYTSNHLDSSGNWKWLSATERQAEIQRELPIHETFMAQVRASVPRPEIDLLQQRALEVMRTAGQDILPVPEERQLTPVKPLIEVRF